MKDLLCKKFPDPEQKQSSVAEKVLPDDELMETLETELDKESSVNKNWYHVGKKFGLSEETLQEIRIGSYENNVGGFFEVVYASFPKLTVEEFKKHMVDINRNDVVDKISDVSEGPMKEKIPLHSDVMRSICGLLSKCGVLKDWKYFAAKLGMKYHEYKIFEKETQRDPTRLLFEWKVSDDPDLNVFDLCTKLRGILRNDVVEEIKDAYKIPPEATP